VRKACVGDALDPCVAPASATRTVERGGKVKRAHLGASLADGGMLPLRWSLEPSEPVPRGAKGLTADGVLPNIPYFKLGCSGHSDKPSALRRMTHRGDSTRHAVTRDKSACACASRFSNQVIEPRILLRFALGVVTASNSAMTSHMSPRRHHLLRRKRHKTGEVLPTRRAAFLLDAAARNAIGPFRNSEFLLFCRQSVARASPGSRTVREFDGCARRSLTPA
jgi:hypothetical protein